MIICKKCNKEKRESEFTKDKNSKTGYRNICKDCRNKKDRDNYLEEQKEIYGQEYTIEQVKNTYEQPRETSICGNCPNCKFVTNGNNITIYKCTIHNQPITLFNCKSSKGWENYYLKGSMLYK